MSVSSNSSRIFGLDLIRALAITGVIVGHGAQLLPSSLGRYILIFNFQTWGVELFFVLSGFLIGGILLAQKDELPPLPLSRDIEARKQSLVAGEGLIAEFILGEPPRQRRCRPTAAGWRWRG